MFKELKMKLDFSSGPNLKEDYEEDPKAGDPSEKEAMDLVKDKVKAPLKDNEVGKDKPESRGAVKGKRLFLTVVGMLLSVLLTALDQGILSPAIPAIASEFNALDKISWAFNSYFITQLSSLLLYGQLLTIFDQKGAFLLSTFIFTFGSLLCGLARNLVTLVIGRAISGSGGGGVIIACLSLIAEITTLENRPKIFASFGIIFAISSIGGPLLGGVITDHLGWRWCFWCNLPVGALSIFSNLILISSNNNPDKVSDHLHEKTDKRWKTLSFGKFVPSKDSFLHKLGTLDFLGAGLISGAIVLLVLPLQWGGNQYPWGDKAVILPLVASVLLFALFFVWESFGMGKEGEGALIPLRLFKNKTQVGATLQCIFMMMNFFIPSYFLPIQFQAIKHSSATKSGLQMIPMMLSVVFASGVSGFFVSLTGYYLPPMILGPMITTVASGLMSTLDENSQIVKYYGYEVMAGFGFGIFVQNALFAVQANVEEVDVPQATGLVSFGKLLGSVIGVAIAQSIFENFLGSGLNTYLKIPSNTNNSSTIATDTMMKEIPSIKILKSSVAAIYEIKNDQIRSDVTRAYGFALKKVYLIGIPTGFLAVLTNVLVKNKNIKKDKNNK